MPCSEKNSSSRRSCDMTQAKQDPKSLGRQLHRELRRGKKADAEKMLSLIARGADTAWRSDFFTGHIIGMAIEHGHVKVVAAILDKGDIDPLNHLWYAIAKKNVDVFRTVLDSAIRQKSNTYRILKKNLLASSWLQDVAPQILPLLEAADATFSAPLPVPSPEWSRPAPDKVMHAEFLPGMKSRLFDIFNFTARERTLVTQDLQTGLETPSAPVSFDAVGKDVLQKALTEFTRLGGDPGAEIVFRKKLVKPPVL